MVTITLHCPHCQSDALVRNGHGPNGKHLYRCRSCARQSRENPTPNAYPQARREEILSAYQERGSNQNPGLPKKRETPTVKENETVLNHRRRTPSCRFKYRSKWRFRQPQGSHRWNSPRFAQRDEESGEDGPVTRLEDTLLSFIRMGRVNLIER